MLILAIPRGFPLFTTPHALRFSSKLCSLDRLVQEDKVESQAELARLGEVTRARPLQIFLLLSLTPAIQEQILCLLLIKEGKEPVLERHLRQEALALDWDE